MLPLTLFTPVNLIFFLLFLQIPENGLSHLPERLLLFRHDYTSSNVLQLVNAASEIADETLIEIVLTATRKNRCFINMFISLVY